jgi:hypothetical protein
LVILWEEHRALHPDGYGYSRFCDLFRGFEQRLVPSMRQDFGGSGCSDCEDRLRLGHPTQWNKRMSATFAFHR